MNLRRNLLLASLAAAAFCTTGAQAQDNVLRVGTDATFPPMEFVENGKRTGFDVELVEAIAKTADSEMIDPENLKWIREQGLYIWVNSINLGRGHELSGTYNDDVALSEGPDAAWGVLMDRGYNVIQTDWPSLLASYRDERFGV